MSPRWVVIALLAAAACGKKEHPVAAPPPDPGSGTAQGSAPVPPDDPIAAFWTWFASHAAELHAGNPIDAMNRISLALTSIDNGVIAEIGGDQGDRTLVISADGHADKFPVVEKIVAAKPAAPIPGWNVVAFRQRSNGALPVIEMRGQKIELASTKFVATPAGDKLDLTVYFTGPDDDDTRARVGFIVLDHTIGEYDMETRIAGISFAPLAKAPATAKPIAELPAMVDALKK